MLLVEAPAMNAPVKIHAARVERRGARPSEQTVCGWTPIGLGVPAVHMASIVGHTGLEFATGDVSRIGNSVGHVRLVPPAPVVEYSVLINGAEAVPRARELSVSSCRYRIWNQLELAPAVDFAAAPKAAAVMRG